ELEEQIASIWGQVLGIDQIGFDDNFFELGGNSLIGLQVVARLKAVVGRPVPAVGLFEAPTVRMLTAYLRPAASTGEERAARLAARRVRASERDGARDIAVIAMTGRFPGAASVETFWENLCAGVESVTRFTDAELLAAGVPAALVQDPQYVKARPVLADVA